MVTPFATSDRQNSSRFPAICLGLGCLIGVVLWTGLAGRAHAEHAADTIDEKRRALAAEIHALTDAATKEDSNNEKGKAHDRLTELRALDVLYVQIQARRDDRQHLEEQKKALDRESESLEKFGLDEPKPYSFLLYDTLQDQLEVEKQRAKALKADGKSVEKLLAAAHEALDQARGPHKDGDSESGQASTPANDLSVERARAQVELREMEVEINKLRAALCDAKQEELSQKIKVVKKDVTFSAADRDKQLGLLAEAETRLKGQRRQVERELQRIEGEADPAQQATTTKAEPGGQAAPRRPGQMRRDAADACQSQIVLIDERLEWLNRLRRVWRQRYDLAVEKPAAARLQQWVEDAAEFRDDLSDAIRSLENRRDVARTEKTSTTLAVERSHNPLPAAQDPQDQAERELRDARLGELAETCAATLLDAQATQRLLDRFQEELKAKLPKENSWGLAGDSISQLFNYPIAGEDDTAVTLGTLLVLLACVTLGIFFAWAVSRAIRDLVLKRFGLHRGKVDAVNSIFFYALCFIFGFTAFRVLNVPLAAFAFLGGAAAIAVGFGSQDIMNNFMSGMILLAEQPIRVGDVATIDGVTGVVMHIGMRSTRLRTESNYEVTVPNKALLDEQVTNFTLSDNMVQVSVVITLDRETKIAEAKEKMLQVVFAHPVIVKSLQPLVLVKEIDNYWLTFEIRFWLQYQNFQQCAMVQSHIMEQIGDMYRPLTDEEKEARKAASEHADTEPKEAPAQEPAAEIAAGEKLAAVAGETEGAETMDPPAPSDPASNDLDPAAPSFASADVTAGRSLDPSAKMMFRKLGRKTIKR
jgi:potassium efflux system protein